MPGEITKLILSVLKHPEDCKEVFDRVQRLPQGNFRRMSVVVAQKGSLLRGFIQDFIFMRDKGNSFLKRQAEAQRDRREMELFYPFYENEIDMRQITKVRMERLERFCHHVKMTSSYSEQDHEDMLLFQVLLKECHITINLHGDGDEEMEPFNLVRLHFCRRKERDCVPFMREDLGSDRDKLNYLPFYQVQFDDDTTKEQEAEVMHLFREAARP